MTVPARVTEATPARKGVAVQRKPKDGARRCACGGIAGPEGECAACRARRLAGLSVQRAPLPGAREGPAAGAGSWLVEDGEAEPAPGQMPKSLWLAELNSALCARADEELKPTGRSAEGCPVLGFWIGYFAGRPAAAVAAAVLRYAPETAAATTAREAIAPIVERVGAAVAVFAQSGRITGIPEGFDPAAPADAEDPGAIQRKARDGGGPAPGGDPQAILGRLGDGRPLDGGVRSRMEPLFGSDLSGVRLHDGGTAASLSASLDARAFTVGNHIALGAGEYQPGTIYGDALLAHGLAHVVQQAHASPSAEPLRNGSPAYEAFEQDADTSAAGVVAGLWGGARGGAANAGPRLRRGLAVQRCGNTVRRCRKRGWSWQVQASYGLGPTCVCRWACMPGLGGRYGNDPTYVPQTSMGPRPDIKDIDDDETIRTYGNAHFTLDNSTCGCIPLNVEGARDPGEESQIPLPQRPVGDITELTPMAMARAIGLLEVTGGGRPAARNEPPTPMKPEVINEPPPVQEPAPPGGAPPPAPARPPRTGNPADDLIARYPNMDPKPSSKAALEELFNRTGGAEAGEYHPVTSRGASAELEAIINLAKRPDVVRVEFVPSKKGERSPDVVYDVRLPDGTVKTSRYEVTAATGALRGDQPVGAGGNNPTGVTEIVAAVRRKSTSTPGKPSQLVAPRQGVPTGGTIAVVLPRSTSVQGPADVAAAMTALATELAGQPHVEVIEFYVPGPKGQAPITYVRAADGTYAIRVAP